MIDPIKDYIIIIAYYNYIATPISIQEHPWWILK